MEGNQIRRRVFREGNSRIAGSGGAKPSDSLRGKRHHGQSYRAIYFVAFNELMKRLRLAYLGDRLVMVAALVPMAAVMRCRHLRTSQAVTEKQRDYRQNCRRDGDNPHPKLDCTAERGGLTTPPIRG